MMKTNVFDNSERMRRLRLLKGKLEEFSLKQSFMERYKSSNPAVRRALLSLGSEIQIVGKEIEDLENEMLSLSKISSDFSKLSTKFVKVEAAQRISASRSLKTYLLIHAGAKDLKQNGNFTQILDKSFILKGKKYHLDRIFRSWIDDEILKEELRKSITNSLLIGENVKVCSHCRSWDTHFRKDFDDASAKRDAQLKIFFKLLNTIAEITIPSRLNPNPEIQMFAQVGEKIVNLQNLYENDVFSSDDNCNSRTQSIQNYLKCVSKITKRPQKNLHNLKQIWCRIHFKKVDHVEGSVLSSCNAVLDVMEINEDSFEEKCWTVEKEGVKFTKAPIDYGADMTSPEYCSKDCKSKYDRPYDTILLMHTSSCQTGFL